jgi:hypothetical protein
MGTERVPRLCVVKLPRPAHRGNGLSHWALHWPGTGTGTLGLLPSLFTMSSTKGCKWRFNMNQGQLVKKDGQSLVVAAPLGHIVNYTNVSFKNSYYLFNVANDKFILPCRTQKTLQ